jgi:RNA-directed DNA polymerase
MVVLVPDSEKGRRWADRALARIREEAEAIGVSLNTDKTRVVRMTEPGASFAFLGYRIRWAKSRRSPRWFACVVPRPDRVTGLLREVRNTLRHCRHLRMPVAVAQVNRIVRGWVAYFRRGNSAEALQKVRYHVERQVRRFAAKKSKRRGFGWKRWSSEVVYEAWGLYDDYQAFPLDLAKVGFPSTGTINPV